MECDELPELLGIDAEIGRVGEPGNRVILFVRSQAAIFATNAADTDALGSDEATLGEGGAIDAVVEVGAIAPAIDVVVADDVEFGEKFRTHAIGGRLRRNLIAAHGDRTSGVFGAEDFPDGAQGGRTVGRGLIGNLIAGAPQHNAGMVAIAADEVSQVALVPLIEVEMVAILDLSFGHAPLVEGLIHDEKAQAVAQVEKLGGEGIMAGADGVRAHSRSSSRRRSHTRSGTAAPTQPASG